jgi:hypothetical protein
MAQQMPAPNHDDQRADLLAMLSAAHELGPDMDTSLVDSYMSRHAAEAERNRRSAVGQPGRRGAPWNGRALWYIGLGILGGALLLGAIGHGGHGGFSFWFPWLFLPWIFFVFLGRRGSYRSRRRYWYDTEDGRRVDVYERTRGYGPSSPGGPGGPGGPGQGYDPHDPYAPPPPPTQRKDTTPPTYGTGFGADFRTDYRRDNREPPADSVV